MSVPLVIDMNLSVEWVAELRSTGPQSVIRAPTTR
jgi:hypothetical protein